MLWNSIISTKGTRFVGLDVGDFYLKTPLDDYEYMNMPIKLFPQQTIEQYYLNSKAKDGKVYLEIHKAIYRLIQFILHSALVSNVSFLQHHFLWSSAD